MRMSIMTEITNIEAILENHPERIYLPEEIASFHESLFTLNHIVSLWESFGDVPMNTKLETIEEEWHGFPAGTHREDIWHWFEKEFEISVADDLIYE